MRYYPTRKGGKGIKRPEDILPVRLDVIDPFSARGMHCIHRWRLVRRTPTYFGDMGPFRRFDGQVWADRAGRLLIRFQSQEVNEYYYLVGINVSEVKRGVCARDRALMQGMASVKIVSNVILSSGCNPKYLRTDDDFWLSWTPSFVRDAWNDWIESIED